MELRTARKLAEAVENKGWCDRNLLFVSSFSVADGWLSMYMCTSKDLFFCVCVYLGLETVYIESNDP